MEECDKTGERIPEMVMVEKSRNWVIYSSTKSRGFAALLSLLTPGLGQIYNGQVAKGLTFLAINIVNVLLMIVVVGFITYPAFWIYAIWDAWGTASKTNEQLRG